MPVMSGKMIGLFLGLAVIYICGCMNGYYKVDSSVDEPKSVLPYVEVDALGKTSEMDESEMPVVVRVEEGEIIREESPSALWALSLGIIPHWTKYSLPYKMIVRTPIGKKEIKYSAIDKYWFGWIPCIIPCPGLADERYYFDSIDKEFVKKQLKRFGENAKERMIRSAVGQFKMEDYVAHVQKEKRLVQETKARELARVAQKKSDMAKLLLEGKYEQVIAECEKESPFEAGKFAQYGEDAKKGIEERARKEEEERVAKRKGEVEVLLANGKFDEAIAASSREQGEIWEKFKADAKKGIEDRNKKEEAARLARRKAELEQLLSAGKYEQVIAECEKESPFEAGKFAQFLTDAKQKIAERDRKAAQERIAKRKAEVQKMVDSEQWGSVIVECKRELAEESRKAGWTPEDDEIWKGFKQKAEENLFREARTNELVRIASRKKEVDELMKSRKFGEVVKACNQELFVGQAQQGHKDEDDKIWEYLRTEAERESSLARDKELERIESRKKEIECLCENKKWDAAIAICDEEENASVHNEGWMKDDFGIWERLRINIQGRKACALAEEKARYEELAKREAERKSMDEAFRRRDASIGARRVVIKGVGVGMEAEKCWSNVKLMAVKQGLEATCNATTNKPYWAREYERIYCVGKRGEDGQLETWADFGIKGGRLVYALFEPQLFSASNMTTREFAQAICDNYGIPEMKVEVQSPNLMEVRIAALFMDTPSAHVTYKYEDGHGLSIQVDGYAEGCGLKRLTMRYEPRRFD